MHFWLKPLQQRRLEWTPSDFAKQTHTQSLLHTQCCLVERKVCSHIFLLPYQATPVRPGRAGRWISLEPLKQRVSLAEAEAVPAAEQKQFSETFLQRRLV